MILFVPNIDQKLSVSPLLLAPHIPSTVVLRFIAKVEDDGGEYERISKHGAKVQLWTNCPCSDGTSGWRELDFLKDPGGQQLSLALAVVLAPGVGELEFCYTYRVLHPDGSVEWLGKFGQNGLCVVHKLRSHAFLSDKWQSKDSNTYSLHLDGRLNSYLEVLSGLNTQNFFLYTIDSDDEGYDRPCSLLFAVPRNTPDSHVIPHAFSISSSLPHSITLSSTGAVNVADVANNSLRLQVYDTETDVPPFIERAITHTSSSTVRMLSFDHQKNGLLVLMISTARRYPMRLVAIELFQQAGPRTTEIELKSSDVEELASSVCIYPRSNSGSRLSCFLWEDLPSSSSKLISVSTGIQYVLSTEYRLRARGEVWRISIVSDHTLVSTSLHQSDVGLLPTPPPSPRVSFRESQASKEMVRPATVNPRQAKGITRTLITTLIQFMTRYMRFWIAVTLFPIHVFIRTLSIFRGPKSQKLGGNRIIPSTGSQRPKQDHDIRPASTAGAATNQDSANSIQNPLCKSLSAQVQPGVLMISLRPEAGAGIDNRANVLTLKQGDRELPYSVGSTDDGPFLLANACVEGGHVEITGSSE